MKYAISILFLFLFLFLKSQNEINLENNLTGIYSKSTTSNLGLNFNGLNVFYHNNLSIDFNTNYLLKLSNKITENEFLHRGTIDYDRDKFDAFITHQYNYSLIRKIESDNWIGIGFGLKKKFTNSKISFSYAIIYQSTNYSDSSIEKEFRHSLRLKYKIDKKLIGFSTEFYYQPTISNFSDYIILGTSKIVILPNNKINFIIQDVVNIRSKSDVTTIHNLTIGFSVKINKKFEDKN